MALDRLGGTPASNDVAQALGSGESDSNHIPDPTVQETYAAPSTEPPKKKGCLGRVFSVFKVVAPFIPGVGQVISAAIKVGEAVSQALKGSGGNQAGDPPAKPPQESQRTFIA